MRIQIIGAVLAAGVLLGAASPDRTDPARLSDTVRTLASPEFEGRAPGTPGETKTIAYLIQRFKALGLQPGGPSGSWVQPVPLIHTRIDLTGSVSVKPADGAALSYKLGEQINLTTVRPDAGIAIAAAPMVFVGYGVTAPPQKWDDFKSADLTGKIAVFLVNDPDFEAGPGDDAAGRFGGRRMTYYGRWTYKFDEAARRGAIGALIVHDTGGAGYGWATVNANQGENYDIVRSPGDRRVAIQGWIEHDAADALFKRAGLDLDALRVRARSAGFKPVAMGATLDARLAVQVDRLQSANVLARIPGTRFPRETVMFGAHWDAYGKSVDGSSYRPGANDDALGAAGVIELARQFAAAPPPQRSLVFALWTGEERGLLGSEYYATHPLYPLATTVANLTLDILQTAGPARDVVLVGEGQSELERYLAVAATAQGRTVTSETFSERGLFFRADHFSLAKRGVPSLLIMALGGANDLVAGGRTAGRRWLDGYTACYHKDCDRWAPDWDLRGAAADIDLFRAIGWQLASGRAWPDWNPANPFAAIRAKDKAARR